MSRRPLVSIIIDNYNYDRFLGQAISSALGQTYPNVEVVVVDDGSTDGSREIIAGYGDRVVPVLKGNGGMASAFNAGFAASRGEIVLFLDSDDMLLPKAAEQAVELFRDGGVAKVHWRLWKVDEHGAKTGEMYPEQPLPEGDLREVVIRDGPVGSTYPPTSGNAWSRRFLEKVFPIPEFEFRRAGESYLVSLAPIYGTIKSVAEPQALYRVHGGNDWAMKTQLEQVRYLRSIYPQRCRALSEHLRCMGIEIGPEAWTKGNAHYEWWEQLDLSAQELVAVIPAADTFILVDEDQWNFGETVEGRRVLPFLERDGQYWGPPPDDQAAVRELERLRHSGATFMVFAWPAFWWLDHYTGLHRYLRSAFRCVLENDRLVVFDLRP